MEKKCKNCIHFRDYTPVGEDSLCYRYPEPIETNEDHFCGEFVPKDRILTKAPRSSYAWSPHGLGTVNKGF